MIARKPPPFPGQLAEFVLPGLATRSSFVDNSWLGFLRDNRIPVTACSISGVALRGLVGGFDAFTVLLLEGARPALVYKHAIVTLGPSKAFALPTAEIIPTDS